MYLLTDVARSTTKWRELGALGLPISELIRYRETAYPTYRPPVYVAPRPAPTPVAITPPTPTKVCPAWGCLPMPIRRPPVPLPPAPIVTPKPPTSTAATAGTPVPPGYSPNQFFVATDGSVWEYSAAASKWISQGVPYNVGAPASSAPPAASGSSSGAAPAPQPVSVNIATPAAASSYQAILDWLTQETLINGVPNWVIGGGAALLAFKLMNSSKGGR